MNAANIANLVIFKCNIRIYRTQSEVISKLKFREVIHKKNMKLWYLSKGTNSLGRYMYVFFLEAFKKKMNLEPDFQLEAKLN